MLGAPDIVYVSVSPSSTSANTLLTEIEYAASSAVLASAIAFATVGASLVLVTVSMNVSETLNVPVPSSVAVTTIVC